MQPTAVDNVVAVAVESKKNSKDENEEIVVEKKSENTGQQQQQQQAKSPVKKKESSHPPLKEEPTTTSSPTKAKSPPSPKSPSTAANPSSPSKAAKPLTGESSSSSTKESTETAEQAKLFLVEEHHDTKEVIERLLDVKGLEESVTGIWGWMSGGVTKVAEKATQVAEQASQQATIVAEKASHQATIVAEKATQQATIVAEKASKARALATQQATELAATVSKTMEDKISSTDVATSKSPIAGVAALPWDSAHPERRAEARERVLKLSMDDHTFTIPPPKEAAFVYDAAARELYAARMLDTDALLSAKRFKLVPKSVDEHEFWRNYFYRVDLILNAMGVPPPPIVGHEQDKESSKLDAINQEAVNPDWEEEMRKEIAAAEASHVEDGGVKEDENFDMLEDDLEFEDDGDLEKSINDLKM
jgi:hypothetical protein